MSMATGDTPRRMGCPLSGSPFPTPPRPPKATFVLWLLGMVTTYTLGGWLHILLVIAVVFLLIRVIRGEPV